jgi:hypothetical protein
MISFKNLTIKNFMSIGNATQAISLDRTDLTLVLGENLDLGSNGSRNGVGKCVCINTMVKVKNTTSGEIYETSIGNLFNAAKNKKIT